MKASELRTKNLDALRTQLMNLREELFNLRFQRATGGLTATARVEQVKRDIARIETVMREGGYKKD